MPEKFPAELEGTDVNITSNDWISYFEDAGQIHRLLEQLTLKKAA
jgi:hypothetical protein